MEKWQKTEVVHCASHNSYIEVTLCCVAFYKQFSYLSFPGDFGCRSSFQYVASQSCCFTLVNNQTSTLRHWTYLWRHCKRTETNVNILKFLSFHWVIWDSWEEAKKWKIMILKKNWRGVEGISCPIMLGAFLQKLDSLLHFLHLHLTVFLSGVTKKFNLEWSTKKLHFNSSFSCAL